MHCRQNSVWKVNIVYTHKFYDCYSILAQVVQFSLVQKHPPEVFYKKVVFKNFAIVTEKHLCWSLQKRDYDTCFCFFASVS